MCVWVCLKTGTGICTPKIAFQSEGIFLNIVFCGTPLCPNMNRQDQKSFKESILLVFGKL